LGATARQLSKGPDETSHGVVKGSGIKEKPPTVSEEGGRKMKSKGWAARCTAGTVLVGALTLLGAAQVYAGTLEAVKARGVLIVGVREDFPPLAFLDGTGKPTGFEVDLARYLARQLLGDEGKLQLVPVHAGDRLTSILSGSSDLLIAAVSATEDRAAVFALSEPYFLSGTLLLVPRNSSIQGLPDVKGKRVAVLEGSIQEVSGWRPVYPEAIRVKFRKVAAAVDALRAGQVDAFAEDDILVLALARQYPDLAAVGKPFRPHPYAIAMHKDDGELLAWVNDQLRKAKADGTYDALWNRYFGDAATILLRP
jgi:ABC-type amino acid transport substrate-binding protein